MDKKLTHEEFKQELATRSEGVSPLFATLSLLLIAFGVALSAAGLFMMPVGIPVVAAGAAVQTIIASGIICAIAGGVGFFKYSPDKLSTLSDDFGQSYYRETSPNA